MIHPEFNITDIKIGTHRTLVYLANIQEVILRKASHSEDVHQSLYRFDEAIHRYVNNEGGGRTTSGFHGNCYADFVPFEFDGKDLAESCEWSLKVLEALAASGVEHTDCIRLFYSGNRSIHILVPTLCFGVFDPNPDFDRVLFEIMLRTMEPHGLVEKLKDYDAWKSDYLDLELYKPQHLLRYPNSLHEKTRRYKVPLSFEMLSDPAAIIEASQKRRPQVWADPKTTEASIAIGDAIRKKLESGVPLRRASRTGSGGSNAFKRRDSADVLEASNPGLSEYVARMRKMEDLWRGEVSDGEWRGGIKGRRQALLSLTGQLKARQFPKEQATIILHHWNSSNLPPLEDKRFFDTINSVFRR